MILLTESALSTDCISRVVLIIILLFPWISSWTCGFTSTSPLRSLLFGAIQLASRFPMGAHPLTHGFIKFTTLEDAPYSSICTQIQFERWPGERCQPMASSASV
uniref:Uncharacterized protein n=2 Tax=Trichobilharzia regenti TaxID=157069 RepID=A0AA85KD00_TRIRE|nr:unnamed protein product [Trichobilharzia regenti]